MRPEITQLPGENNGGACRNIGHRIRGDKRIAVDTLLAEQRRIGSSFAFLQMMSLFARDLLALPPQEAGLFSFTTLDRVTREASGGTLTPIPSACSSEVIFFNSSIYLRGDLYHFAKMSGKRAPSSSLNCAGVPLHSCCSCIRMFSGWRSTGGSANSHPTLSPVCCPC